jgi:hypothetical protein
MSSQGRDTFHSPDPDASDSGAFWGLVQVDRLSDVAQKLILRTEERKETPGGTPQTASSKPEDNADLNEKGQNTEHRHHHAVEILLSRVSSSDGTSKTKKRPYSRVQNNSNRTSKPVKQRRGFPLRRTKSRQSAVGKPRTATSTSRRWSQTNSRNNNYCNEDNNNNNTTITTTDNNDTNNNNTNNRSEIVSNNCGAITNAVEVSEPSSETHQRPAWKANALPAFPQQGPDLTVRGSSTGMASDPHTSPEHVHFPHADLLHTSFRFPTNTRLTLEPVRYLKPEPLRLLDLEGWSVDDHTFSACIGATPNASVVHCPVSATCKLTVQALDKIATCANVKAWTNLRHLDLSGCFASTTSQILDKSMRAALRKCGPSLLSLALNGTSITDSTLIAVGKYCGKLTRLEICHCR